MEENVKYKGKGIVRFVSRISWALWLTLPLIVIWGTFIMLRFGIIPEAFLAEGEDAGFHVFYAHNQKYTHEDISPGDYCITYTQDYGPIMFDRYETVKVIGVAGQHDSEFLTRDPNTYEEDDHYSVGYTEDGYLKEGYVCVLFCRTNDKVEEKIVSVDDIWGVGHILGK